MIITDGVLTNVEDKEIPENGEFIIPSQVTSIGAYAFMNCTNLKKVEIKFKGDTLIGDSAFFNCSSLTDVQISKGKTSIGQRAFMNCTNLKSVVIHGSVKSFGTYAFWGCNKLQPITIEGSIPSSDEYESECAFPDNIKLVKENYGKTCHKLGNDSSQSANLMLKIACGVGAAAIGLVCMGVAVALILTSPAISFFAVGGITHMAFIGIASFIIGAGYVIGKGVDAAQAKKSGSNHTKQRFFNNNLRSELTEENDDMTILEVQ